MMSSKNIGQPQKVSKARQRTQARFQQFLSPSGEDNLISDTSFTESPKDKKVNSSKIEKAVDDVSVQRKQRRKDKLKSLGKINDASPNDQNEEETEKVVHRNSKSRKKRRPRGRSDDELIGASLLDRQSDEDAANDNDAFEKSGSHPEDVLQEMVDNVQKRLEEEALEDSKNDTVEKIIRALERKRKDDDLLFCINIHKCDQLKPDVRVSHPLVQIHLIDINTGHYIKKSSKDRKVTSFYEDAHDSVDYILPLMTQPYDFRKNKSLLPRWEEVLMYNEIYSYFLQREAGDPEVLIMFEILDFLSMSVTSKTNKETSEKGWHHIAWGFLKLVSNGGSLNTEKKVRIQLYHPVTKFKRGGSKPGSLQIFRWWQSGVHTAYPSTLYATIKGVRNPDNMDATNRSMFATQEERGTANFSDFDSELDNLSTTQKKKGGSDQIWKRLPDQPCRIPNNLSLILPSGQKGCTFVKFSQDGRYVACGCATFNSYPIFLYEIPNGKLIAEFIGHAGVIYDLYWSRNGNELLSASSDSSVRSWDTRRTTNHPIKVFPHPKYVYCARFHPVRPRFVATGCFDGVVRVWNKANEGLHGEVVNELHGHQGFVNCLCFTVSGDTLYSADSTGVIIEWSVLITDTKRSRKSSLKDVSNWKALRRIAIKDLIGIEISCIKLHFEERKLLVQSKDSYLRMVDLRSLGTMMMYIGAVNFQHHLRCTMSPCGNFVVAGSEDGLALVWNTETGDLLYTYSEFRFTDPVSCVDFHPYDNYLVSCSYGNGHPVHIYAFDGTKVSKSSTSIEKKERTTQFAPVQSFNNTMTSEKIKNDITTTTDNHRMNRIRETLSSVTEFLSDRQTTSVLSPTQPHVTFTSPASELKPNPVDSTNFLSTWGSDFTPNYTREESVFESIDNPVSPFASQRLGGSARLSALQQQQQQERYLLLARSKSPSFRSPSSSFTSISKETKSNDDKKYQHPRKSKNCSQLKHDNQVISLYEYKAQRDDELNFRANEIITILRSENEHWSFGCLNDGSEGYFPMNYVTSLENSQSQNENDSLKNEHHSVIIGKDGDLKVISGPEESDGSLVEILHTDRGKRGKNSRKKKLKDIRT